MSTPKSATGDDPTLHPVGPLSELDGGRMKRICVGNRTIAVGRWEDRVVAIDDRCPHQGASLSGGRLRPAMKAGEDSDPAIDPGAPVVICPWHRWEFDGGSGCSTWDASYKVRSYPTDVRDGVVWVQVP